MPLPVVYEGPAAAVLSPLSLSSQTDQRIIFVPCHCCMILFQHFDFFLQCSKMSVPRSLFYFGELGGYFYAVSGYSAPNCDTPTVERYCAQTDKWHMVAPLLVKVHELAGGAFVKLF